MDNIINKILEIDRQSDEKIEAARKQSEDIKKQADSEGEKIRLDCIERADKRIEKVEENEKKHAEETISGLNAEKQSKIDALDKLFNESHDNWKNEIVKSIIG